MKYTLAVIILGFLPLIGFGNPKDFTERHKAAAPLDSILRKNNIMRVTEEAAEFLLNLGIEPTMKSRVSGEINKIEEYGISIEGEWKFKTYSFYFEKNVEQELYGMLAGSTFLLTNYNKDFYPIIGEYDETSQILTISKRYVGRDWRGRYHFIYPYVPKGNGGVVPGEIQAFFNKETGELTFPEGVMLSWIDYEDPEGTIDPYDEMEWHIVHYAGRIGDLEKENSENWISLGNATMIDGWLLPRFGFNQTREQNRLHPELLQYKNNPNIYRLKNPFDEEPLAQHNKTNKTGYIEFDVTDPDHVVFNRIDCGWICPEIGITKLYCYNLLGYYMEEYKLMGEKHNVADFLMFYNPDIAFTTFHDGKVDLGVTLYAGELVYDANFGEVNYPAGGNIWKGMDMTTKIYFPGIPVTEPKIEFASEPEIYLNSQEKTAEIKIEFMYENQPENSTIFVMVFDEISGWPVSRKYVNQRYNYNEFSFILEGIDSEKNYNYSIVIRMEGSCSETLYQSDKKELDFIAARRNLDKTGISTQKKESDSPVYFNLQGVKVDSPRKGEIYIMRKGNKATKLKF